MRPVTPRGFRDVLALEAAERDALVARMNRTLGAWGYDYIETPVVEEAQTMAAASGSTVGADLFRLFDSDGPMLVLRPEMTVPIARLVATRMDADQSAHRLRYSGRVFRDQPSMRGQAREFMQVGVELIGVNGPSSDAEIVALMVDALDATGLREYTIALGTVAVLRALIAAAGMDEVWSDAVFAAAHERNLVRISELASADGVPSDLYDALRVVPAIRGGREAIDECRAVAGTWASDTLDELEETWDLLVLQKCDHRVSIDFGIMRSFDYYTGVVLEAYGSGPGLPLGGGGRYDDVLEAFDSPAPAAGFALRVERVHQALAAEGTEIPVEELDVVIGGASKDVFAMASSLRADGLRVRMVHDADMGATLAIAGDAGATRTLFAEGGRIMEIAEGVDPVPVDVDASDGRGSQRSGS